MLYSHSVGFVVIRYLHLFVFHNESHSCYIRIPLVSHWFVIRIYSFIAMIGSHVIIAIRWFRSDSFFASIRFSQWFAVMLYSHFVGFAFIRYSHLFLFGNDSQSCYIRIPLVSQWFVICIYSFFAMIRSHVIFAFRWFRCDSLFASIRFSPLLAVMLYSHSVGFVVIRYFHLFVFRNDSHSCFIRIQLVSHWFVIRIYSFFAMIRSHVIFAFPWFRSDSLDASIRFSQWFAVIVLICYIRIPLVSQ
jgi:hypothetical protein